MNLKQYQSFTTNFLTQNLKEKKFMTAIPTKTKRLKAADACKLASKFSGLLTPTMIANKPTKTPKQNKPAKVITVVSNHAIIYSFMQLL